MEQEQVFLATKNDKKTKDKPVNVKRIVLLSIVLLVLIAALLLFALPGFYIEDIVIQGNRMVSNEEIINISQITVGDHLLSQLGGSMMSVFQLRNGRTEAILKDSISYIEDVSVQVMYPSTIVIEISERLKMAYLELPDGYAVIDIEGYVLEINYGAPPEGIPLIKGVSVESATLGAQIVFVQQYGFDQNLIILSAIYSADAQYTQSVEALMPHVQSIRYVEGGTSFISVELPVSKRVIHVKIGSLNNIDEDMTWLRHAVLSGVFEDATGSLLDMTGSNHSLR